MKSLDLPSLRHPFFHSVFDFVKIRDIVISWTFQIKAFFFCVWFFLACLLSFTCSPIIPWHPPPHLPTIFSTESLVISWNFWHLALVIESVNTRINSVGATSRASGSGTLVNQVPSWPLTHNIYPTQNFLISGSASWPCWAEFFQIFKPVVFRKKSNSKLPNESWSVSILVEMQFIVKVMSETLIHFMMHSKSSSFHHVIYSILYHICLYHHHHHHHSFNSTYVPGWHDYLFYEEQVRFSWGCFTIVQMCLGRCWCGEDWISITRTCHSSITRTCHSSCFRTSVQQICSRDGITEFLKIQLISEIASSVGVDFESRVNVRATRWINWIAIRHPA